MQRFIGLPLARAAVCFVLFSSCAGAVAADDLASRLGALMGQERQALDVMPEARLSVLTAPLQAVLLQETAEIAAPVQVALLAPAGSAWEALLGLGVAGLAGTLLAYALEGRTRADLAALADTPI